MTEQPNEATEPSIPDLGDAPPALPDEPCHRPAEDLHEPHQWEAPLDGPAHCPGWPTSGLVRHARRELSLIGEDQDVIDGLCKAVQAFADMGHSGGSAHFARSYLERLLRFQPLSDLTDDPAEWIDRHAEGKTPEPFWQSRRHPEAMSHDAGHTYWLVSERDAAGSMDTTPLHTSKPAVTHDR